MFPDSVRNAANTVYSSSVKGANAAYKFTRSTLWIVGTSVVILALPVVFEVERVQTEEAQLMQQRQVIVILFLQTLHVQSTNIVFITIIPTFAIVVFIVITSAVTKMS